MTDEERERRRELAAAAPADCDVAVLALCRQVGHRLEGRVVELERGAAVLIGRCQQCGLGYMTDGS